MPFNLGGPELMVILVIVLIVFGAGKLPNVMRDLGAGVREFKKAQQEDEPQPASGPSGTTSVTAPPTTMAATTTTPAPAQAVPAAPTAPAAPSAAPANQPATGHAETGARA